MQASPFNNPMFAQGLSGIVGAMIGNPEMEARNALMASEALLNNQTAQYRTAIGDTGLSGDLASMMIRSLQAGPDYARVAPGIGEAALAFSGAGYGNMGQTIAQQLLASAQPAAPAYASAPVAAQEPAPVQGQYGSQQLAPATAMPAAAPAALPVITPRDQSGGVGDMMMQTVALNQAREAIAMGRDPAAVAARLAQLGIDPGRL